MGLNRFEISRMFSFTYSDVCVCENFGLIWLLQVSKLSINNFMLGFILLTFTANSFRNPSTYLFLPQDNTNITIWCKQRRWWCNLKKWAWVEKSRIKRTLGCELYCSWVCSPRLSISPIPISLTASDSIPIESRQTNRDLQFG